MVSRLNVNWRHTHSVVVLVLVAIGVLFVVINPLLWWAPLLGLLVGVFVWFPKVFYAVVVVACVCLPLGLIIWVLLFGCVACGPAPSEAWGVEREVVATYDEEEESWILEDRFLVPPESRDAAVTYLMKWEIGDQPGEDEQPPEEVPEAEALLLEQIDGEGWIRQADLDGNLVFAAPQREIPAEIALYPLTTRLHIDVEDIELPDGFFSFAAGEGSTLTLYGPTNLVMSSDPISEGHRVPSGDQWIVPLVDRFSVRTVEIEAASPLVRQEPLTTLTRLSYASITAWILAGLVGIAMASLKDRVRKWFDGLMKDPEEDDAPKPEAAKPTKAKAGPAKPKAVPEPRAKPAKPQ